MAKNRVSLADEESDRLMEESRRKRMDKLLQGRRKPTDQYIVEKMRRRTHDCIRNESNKRKD